VEIEIRNGVRDEFEAAVDVMSTAFLERPDLRVVAESVVDSWDPERTWIAFDGPRAVGTFRSWATALAVPGGAMLPAAAMTAVAVLPGYRRRGILTGMTAREHAALQVRGEAVGILYASEYPIYGRFGYAPATRWADWAVNPRATHVHGVSSGTVELVRPDAEAKETVKALFDTWRPRQAGEISRREIAWDLRLGLREEPWGPSWKGWLAVHRDASGAPDGFALYKAQPKWEEHLPQGILEVSDLVTLTDGAYADLLRFLMEMDLVGTVRLEGRRVGERLPWFLTNARAARPTNQGDGLWVRLFDVPRALEARAWERTGTLVLDVVDTDAGTGTRRLLLDASPDGATCRATDRSPDLTLPVAALGGAYLGGTSLLDLVVATGADEHRPGALAEADALLRTASEPWCSTFF
jgi:predicted acetyltransferase